MSDREAFEKWYMSRSWVDTFDPLMKHDHGAYIVAETCEAWQAWQAALQSGEPVAWMHNTRKNVDVIGTDVKQLFTSMDKFYGGQGVNKGEHYTIPLYTVPQQAASATTGMNLGERIKHVGGRENAQGYIEFGSVMAVKALIDHVLRDLYTNPQPVVPLQWRVVMRGMVEYAECNDPGNPYLDQAKALLSAGKGE